MTNKLLAITLVTIASATASASPASEMCDGINKSTPLKKWAYETILRSDAWKGTLDSCSVDGGEYADRYDSPQIVRVAEVMQMFGGYSGKDLRDGHGSFNGADGAYAISRLDRAQLEAEIKSLPTFAKERLLEAFDYAAEEVKVWEERRAKEVKGVAGKAVWKEGYAAAIAAETKEGSAHAEDIAFALGALDDAAEGKACPDVQPRFAAFLAKAAPKTKEQAIELMTTSVTAELLWQALGQCALASGNTELAVLATEARGAFNYGRYIKGPSHRVAARIHRAYEAASQKTGTRGVAAPSKGINGALVTLSLDAPRSVKDLHLASAQPGPGLIQSSFWGVVAAKQAKGKGYLEISFKKNMQVHWKQSCWTSDRISGIDERNGNVEYASDCVTSKGKKRNVAPFPVKVPAAFAKHLRPGDLMFFIELTDGNGGAKATHIALPIDVYKSDKKGAPLVGLLGAGW